MWMTLKKTGHLCRGAKHVIHNLKKTIKEPVEAKGAVGQVIVPPTQTGWTHPSICESVYEFQEILHWLFKHKIIALFFIF